MNGKTRLKELAAFSEAAKNGTLKELGIFTRNKPQFDENGNYIGMREEVSPLKVGLGVAAAGGLGYGGYRGHKYVMDKYGNVQLLTGGQWDFPHRPGSSVGPTKAGVFQAYGNFARDMRDRGVSMWNKGARVAGFKLRNVSPFLERLFKKIAIK